MRYGVSEEPDLTKPTITYGHGLLEDNDTLWDTLVYTTSGVGLVTTTVDASLTEADDFWNGFYIKYLTGANAGAYREITDFDNGTATLTHVAFGNITGNGDTYVFSKWRRTAGTQDLDGEAISTYYDWLKLDCAAAEAGDYCYWDLYHHATTGPGAAGPLNLNTDISRKVLVRWKTGVASAGLGLTAVAVYQGGTSDYIVGTVYTSPQFSTSWTVSTLTLDTGKTLDYIRVYAYSDTDATTGSVYVDFILVCQGIFTWPFVSGGVELEGFNNYQHLKIPGKVGNATQYLGGDDSTIRVYGDIDSTGVDGAGVPLVGEGWHGRWTTHDGEAFYQILHYAFNDPWEWFTSDVASLKVTLDRMRISQARSNENLLSYELDMHEYRLGSASAETNLERFGIT